MTNPIEAMTALVKSFVDKEPKPPLHVGEVMSLWTALAAYKEARALYQAAENMTTDTDLKHALKEALEGSSKDVKMLEEFMVKEGIPIPHFSPDKPHTEPTAVPEGAKLDEDEIANLVSVKVATAIVFCGQAMSQCIRNDVALIFMKSQINLMNYAAPLKEMMKKRGWLKHPPAYHPPGEPKGNN
ncbi:DUF3231 family protein [Bacillus timonensis]|nr:DUF3231 family protein [Bacillus timonensis]